jgi:hypothetical protein
MKDKVLQQIKLYKKGFSSRQIAKLLHLSSSVVRANMTRYGINRQAFGRNTEEKVAQWIEKKGLIVKRQPGDSFFDLLVGKDKIDVKSAHLSFDKYRNNYYYKFQLQDRTSRLSDKDLSLIDWFYLVFLETNAIFRINPTDLNCRYTLSIAENLHSKYPLQFLGYLR